MALGDGSGVNRFGGVSGGQELTSTALHSITARAGEDDDDVANHRSGSPVVGPLSGATSR
jgi:hypothetical protein